MKNQNGKLPPSPYDDSGSSGAVNRPLTSENGSFYNTAAPGGNTAPGGSTRYTGFNSPSVPRSSYPRRTGKRRGGFAVVALILAAVLLTGAGLAWFFLRDRGGPMDDGRDTPISAGTDTGDADAGGRDPNSGGIPTANGETGGDPTTGGGAVDDPQAGNEDTGDPTEEGENTAPSGDQDPEGTGAPIASIREQAAQTIPHFETRYFLQNLSDERLKFVTDLYAAVMAFDTDPVVTANVTDSDMTACTAALTADCPELFQLDFSKYGYSYTYDSAGRVLGMKLRYVMDESEYRQRREACEQAITQIVSAAGGLDELGRERAAFDAIAAPAVYDKDSDMCGNAYGALVEHRAKCIGFAHAMKWAMDELGIETTTISAAIPGQAEGHAWNQVLLQGQWYRVDLTASASNESGTDAGFDRPIYYALNISDFIDTTSYVLDQDLLNAAPIPTCSSMDLSPYALDGRLVRSGEDGAARLNAALETAYATGGGTMILQFEDKDAYLQILNSLSDLVTSWTQERGLGFSYNSLTSDQFNLIAIKISFI